MSIQWKGIMPAVTTKFTDNDTLDLKTFELNIHAQLEARVHGIVLGGTLGEASTLLDEEKRLLTTATVDIVKGNVPEACPLSEAILSDSVSHMGDIAIRTGRKITWDPVAGEVVGDAEANSLFVRQHREPYSV